MLPWEPGGVNPLLVLLLALALDRVLGEPRGWLAACHPVAVMGNLIGRFAVEFNRGSHRQRFWMGVMTLAIVVALAGLIATLVAAGLALLPFGWLGESLVVAVLLSAGGLQQAVAAVGGALAAGDLAGARAAVAHIVSRPVRALDESGVVRAGLESLGENSNDAVVAPAFWFLLLGLPGIAIYKTINTADSMLGYRQAPWRDFGRASARLDDMANWLPARLTAGLIALAAAATPGADGMGARRVAARDGWRHSSPNAGLGEAALAGAVGCACGLDAAGTARLGPELEVARPRHLELGLAVYARLLGLLASLTAVGWVALIAARGLAG